MTVSGIVAELLSRSGLLALGLCATFGAFLKQFRKQEMQYSGVRKIVLNFSNKLAKNIACERAPFPKWKQFSSSG
ncbi:MAG: hypothetical protein AAF636_20375 [Pseudomonadota bacterium]